MSETPTIPSYETVAQYLGYGAVPCPNLIALLQERHNDLFLPSIEIVSELQGIDSQLTQARLDSMTQKIDDLQVNYTAHVAHLRSEGSRLIKQLSALLDYPWHFDKYAGRFAYQGGSRHSVVNYW